MPGTVLESDESTLQAPSPPSGNVPRTRLVERLLSARAPIIAVVAPAGYGKTTLLAQWAECNERHTAWVSLDGRDNDPAVLLRHVAAALNRVELIDPAVVGSLDSAGMFATPRVLSLLASILSSRRQPFALVIDDLEVIHNPLCMDAVAAMALNIPLGSQLAVASRHVPPLPLPRLRAQGYVIEIGVDDLAMDEADARALLSAANLELGAADFRELLRRTEGWPFVLYLAALAIRTGSPAGKLGRAFVDDDRLVADFVQSEVLSRLSPTTTQFLKRTSVLDRLSGPLCDAVLGVDGSRQVLVSLARSNILLVPLDRRREWYRYHYLFQAVLRADLMRSEPGLVPVLHDRAAAWLEANGLPDEAIDHAQTAGDAVRAARLYTSMAQKAYAAGRVHTALRWLDWFDTNGLVGQYPQVAILGALGEALLGRPTDAERWADIAEAGTIEGLLADGSPLEAWLAVLHACLCRDGVGQMRKHAELARDRLAASSPFQGPALFLAAMSDVLDGQFEAADPILRRAVDACLQTGGVQPAGAALAERAVVAIERLDWNTAMTFADRAVTMIQTDNCDDYLTSMVVFAVAARTAARHGRIGDAKARLARASRLRPMCSRGFPASAQFLLQLGHAHLELADPAGARSVLRQMRDILQVRPGLGTIAKQANDLQSMVDTIAHTSIGASSLTVAELRLLPLLATHLSFREIGERMHLSRHTVRSQATSTYRKLGVTSRSEAIRRAQAVGLVGE